MKIYHNPRCSKSRATLALLEQSGQNFEIVEYLLHPPTEIQLQQIIQWLGLPAGQLVRTGEKRFVELGIDLSALTEDETIALLADNPILLQRPIVVSQQRVIIGRPPENVNELLLPSP